MIWKSQT